MYLVSAIMYRSRYSLDIRQIKSLTRPDGGYQKGPISGRIVIALVHK
jgi:hypothetical protein